MSNNKSSDDRILYSGNSLDTYLKIKSKLQVNGIRFTEESKSKDSFSKFVTKLAIVRVGSLGFSSDHDAQYSIYVTNEDYDKTKQLLNGCGLLNG